jgi:DNA-binding NtrC family response regulator
MPFSEARRRALDDFERRYLSTLLERHGSNMSQAATLAGIDRVYLYRLIRRHGLKR